MIISKASKKDIFWGYSSRFLNIGAGVIIIPVALRSLTTEEMGLWYIFIALAALAQLLEFGFQPTISRMTSYIYSGATELCSVGTPNISEGKLSQQLLYDLINAAKKIYLIVSILTIVVLGAGGTFYLSSFEAFNSDELLAWAVFVTSTVINFYFTYLNGLIIGRGQQKDVYRIVAISKLLMLFVTIPLLYFGWGLISMSIGTFLAMIFSRVMLSNCFYNEERKEIQFIKKGRQRDSLFNTVWLAAWKLGITSLGTFLITKGSMFLVSSYLGLKAAATYGITVQLLAILASVSSMVFMLNLPKLNALQLSSEKENIKELFTKSVSLFYLLYIIGSLGLLFIVPFFLVYIESQTQLLPSYLLLLFLVIQLLETNHSLCATYLTTLNIVPFMGASLLSGLGIIIFSYISLEYTSLGIAGVLLSQGAVQLAYNNWNWPIRTYKHLNRV